MTAARRPPDVTGPPEDRGRKQPAKPVGVLKDGKLVPGIERDDGLQHCRQIVRLSQDAAPFV